MRMKEEAKEKNGRNIKMKTRDALQGPIMKPDHPWSHTVNLVYCV